MCNHQPTNTESHKFLTLAEAKNLAPGTTLYSTIHRNSDGSPQRWKVNGTPRRWKTAPDRIRVPLKHGLRHYDAITDADFDFDTDECTLLSLSESFAKNVLDEGPNV